MIEIRRTTDIGHLMRWRAEVLQHVFHATPDASLLDANTHYYERHLADGSHIAYIAVVEGVETGCGALCIYDEMPSPDNPTGRCAYLMNIYVREPYRNRGIASAIVRRLVNDAVQLDCGKIYLETTDMGRLMYKSLGFSEMKGYLKYEDGKTLD